MRFKVDEENSAMVDFERLQADVRNELVAVRSRGVARLNDPALKGKVDTTKLEAAASRAPGYDDRMTRVAAIYLLLEHEVPRVSQPHRRWLEVLFAIPDKLRDQDPGTLRDELADQIGVSRSKFNRTGGMADQAITTLAAQIVAD